MSATTNIELGQVSIWLPTVAEPLCCIFQDLASLLKVDFNADAEQIVRKEWKRRARRGRLEFDTEADAVAVYAGRDTIVELVIIIHELAKLELPDAEVASAKSFLRKYKRPTPTEWDVGDVFVVPLLDGTFMYGQVLADQIYRGKRLRSPTCALFDFHSHTIPSEWDEVLTSPTIAILHDNSQSLDTGHWRVVHRHEPVDDPDRGPCGTPGKAGAISSSVLDELANAWVGLATWNQFYRDDYLDRFLLNGVTRPTDALCLPVQACALCKREGPIRTKRGICVACHGHAPLKKEDAIID